MTAPLRMEAPAKINLALHVGPRRDDGYHPVATLMVALDGLADTVEARRASARRVTCPGLDGPRNLAWTALDALERHTGRALDLDITITKHVPSPAGLGGGSSDAAAVLRAARALYDLPLDDAGLETVAADVGSDVPFFVRGGAQWARGRGEALSAAPPPRFWGVVTRPAGTLATAAVYAAFDRIGRARPLPPSLPDLSRWWDAPDVRNDLWPAALALCPRLGRVARALGAAGAERVLLCGSGGAMAGLWRDEDAARRAAGLLGRDALAVVRASQGLP